MVVITFIPPKLDLKKSTTKQLNFSNSIFCSMKKTEQLFIIFFFTCHSQKYFIKVFYCKSVLIYYYFPPLIIDLSYPNILYKHSVKDAINFLYT